MTRAELIKRIAQQNPELTPVEVERAAKTVFERIRMQLEQGGRVELRGFGTFEVRRLDPAPARNPRTGEVVSTGTRYRPWFRSGQALRRRLNDERL